MSRARWITGTIGIAILAAAMTPPLVDGDTRLTVMRAFAAVCHQLPDRSPYWNGVQLAACDRCMGIYFGLPLAAALFVTLRRAAGLAAGHRVGRERWLLAASVLPIGIDWGLDAVGLVSNTPASRWMTGLVFGLVAGYFLTVAVGDLRAGSRSSRQ